MSVASDLIRGNTEAIILAHLLPGDSYGYEINKAIQQKTGNSFEFKEATLYSAFRRLEENGCIVSYWGNEQTGARRRYYSVTPLGREAFGHMKTEWRNSKKIIDMLIGSEE